MFLIPALLSVVLDSIAMLVYFRYEGNASGGLFDDDRHKLHSLSSMIDISKSSFDIAVLAGLRILFLLPYAYVFTKRLRILWTMVPFTWEAVNVGLITARLAFLAMSSAPFDVQSVLLLMGYFSVLLNIVCFDHLRSSASPEKRIFLAGALNRAEASTRLLDPSQQIATGELYDGHHEDLDFIASITLKMKRAREYWKEKTETLRVLLNDLSRSKEETHSPFHLVLRLFTYEDVLGDLDEVFAHDPDAIEFYIPQLVTFLVYGAFWSSGSLQEFLLDKCSCSVRFAHRLFWFLNASCLHGSGINQEGVKVINDLIEEVRFRGQESARLLDEGKTPEETGATATRRAMRDGQPRESDDSAETCIDMASLNSDIEEQGARSTSSSMSISLMGSARQQQSQLRQHLGGEVAGGFPLEMGSYKGTDGDYFSVLPRFIEHLVDTTRALMAVPREKRTPELRLRLQELNERYLPSNLTYLPVGNACHRVWAIHHIESFAFSTKERVPCLICFEVVDYNRFYHHKESTKKRWWSMVDNLPHYSHTFRIGNHEWTLRIGENKQPRGSSGGGGVNGVSASAASSFKVGSPVSLSSGSVTSMGRGTGAREEVKYAAVGAQEEEARGHDQDGGHGLKMEGRDSTSSNSGMKASVSSASYGGDMPSTSSMPASGQGRTAPTALSSPFGEGGGMESGVMGQWSSKVSRGSQGTREKGITPLHAQEEGLLVNTHVAEAGSSSPFSGDRVGGSGSGPEQSLLPLRYCTPPPSSSTTSANTYSSGGADEAKVNSTGRRRQRRGEEDHVDVVPSMGKTDLAVEHRGLSHSPLEMITSTDDYGTFSPVPSPTYAASPLLLGPKNGTATGGMTAKGTANGIDGSERRGKGGYHVFRYFTSSYSSGLQPPVIFKEKWREKEARIRKRSPIGHLPGWRLLPIIVKSNDDLRQEQFASQLLRQVATILRDARVPVWMRPYDIVGTSFDGGLLEAIPDTVSLDALKKNDPQFTTLTDFFERLFGPRGSTALTKARQCFVESLAAYSIICYLLQVKDRHNGNILLDAQGHIIHIDFGFILARSPGNLNFESAPFKLTDDFVDLMDGPRSACFKRFRELCVKTFMELRKQRHKIILLVEMMVNGNENLPCFAGKPQATVEALRSRFRPELHDRACMDYVNSLIDNSMDNWRTRWYDRYQSCFVLG